MITLTQDRKKRSFYQQKVISLIPCTGRTGMRWMGRQQNFASMGVQEGYFIPFNIIQSKCCRNPHISIEPRMWFDKGEGFWYPQHESIYCYKSMIHARIFIFAFFWYFKLYFKLHISSNSSKIFVERVDLIIKKYLLRLNLFLEIILVM